MALKIKDGFLYLYYCFDIANEIHLDKVEKVFGKRPEPFELVVERLTPKYIKHRVAPLLLKMGKTSVEKMDFQTEAKIYDFGVITIRFAAKLDGDITNLSKISSKFTGHDGLRKDAKRLVERIKKEIEDSMKKHQVEIRDFSEDYVVLKVSSFDKKMKANDLIREHLNDIGSALRCDSGNLSEKEIQDAMKNPLSYYEDDLVVVDWGASFIYGKGHSHDILDVLEYALIESLELRTYDNVLDTVLDRAYDDLLGKRPFSFYPFGKKMKYLSRVRLEVSDIMEKVSNFIKLVGDVYLAKVYAVATSRFYLDKWRESVNNKMETVHETYSEISHRTAERRMVILEIMIVLLFIIDLVLLFLQI